MTNNLPQATIDAALKADGINDETIRAFWVFHQSNPWIWKLFDKLTFDIVRHGYSIGAKCIMENIRYSRTLSQIRAKVGPGKPFLIDNNFTAIYARLFVLCYPRFRKKLKFRKVRGLSTQRTTKGQEPIRFRAHRSRFWRAA